MKAALLLLVGAPALGALGVGGSMWAKERGAKKLAAQRLALIRTGMTTARAERARKGLAMGALIAPLIDPLLGINRSVASDERMMPGRPLLLGAVAGAAATLVLTRLFGLSMLIAGPAALVIALVIARMMVQGKRSAIHTRMEDEFGLALGVIIRCVRAGLPVTEGMRAVMGEVPAPTGPEFRRCVDQVQLGEDFDDALVKLADRCAIPDYRFFATAVALQRQTGGNLSETLENLADTVRRRKGVRMKAQALTSETRATVVVLAILPAAVGALLMFVNPDYIMQLFTTHGGKTLLGIAMGVQAFGLFVIRTIIRKTLG